jgi:hypothetical protein
MGDLLLHSRRYTFVLHRIEEHLEQEEKVIGRILDFARWQDMAFEYQLHLQMLLPWNIFWFDKKRRDDLFRALDNYLDALPDESFHVAVHGRQAGGEWPEAENAEDLRGEEVLEERASSPKNPPTSPTGAPSSLSDASNTFMNSGNQAKKTNPLFVTGRGSAQGSELSSSPPSPGNQAKKPNPLFATGRGSAP